MMLVVRRVVQQCAPGVTQGSMNVQKMWNQFRDIVGNHLNGQRVKKVRDPVNALAVGWV
jgi:hypothetical protein